MNINHFDMGSEGGLGILPGKYGHCQKRIILERTKDRGPNIASSLLCISKLLSYLERTISLR